jgi:hypothetical protein
VVEEVVVHIMVVVKEVQTIAEIFQRTIVKVPIKI